MRDHYSKCGLNQLASTVRNIMTNMTENELMAQKRLNGIEYVLEESVCQREISGVRNSTLTVGFKNLYAATTKGTERLFQCRTCNEIIKTKNKSERHR